MPFILLPVTAVLLFTAGLLIRKTTIDIHVYDTMIVIPQGHAFGIAALFLFLLWLIYKAAYKVFFSEKWVWFHIISTLVILLAVLLYPLSTGGLLLGDLPARYIEPEPASRFFSREALLLFCIIGLVVIQLIFIIHLLMGLYRKAIRRR